MNYKKVKMKHNFFIQYLKIICNGYFKTSIIGDTHKCMFYSYANFCRNDHDE